MMPAKFLTGELNKEDPKIMHIDLNSCFASVLQQANPLLRGKPIGIVPYLSERSMIIAPSREAKCYGIKVGTSVQEAKALCPDFQYFMPDPPMVRDVHTKMRKIFMDYTPDVVPKSIDEAVLNFKHMDVRIERPMIEIGKEIKERVKAEIGEFLTCNVGIGTSRFIAKTAAGLHKPDGLDVIDHTNMLSIWDSMKLTDLNGIASKYAARLMTMGVFTPREFYEKNHDYLHRFVFHSIHGERWFARLRGWEVDDIEYPTKSVGQSYTLMRKTNDRDELSQLILKLCFKMGTRLRSKNFSARGMHVGISYMDYSYWHMGRTSDTSIFASSDLYTAAMRIFDLQPQRKKVRALGVACYDLSDASIPQLSIFEDAETLSKKEKVTRAIDAINIRYETNTIIPARMMHMENTILDRIPFGGTKYIEDLYEQDLYQYEPDYEYA